MLQFSAWVTGVRNVQKSLLFALLEPTAKMAQLQDENRLTELMVLQEDMKLAPLGDIRDEYLSRQGLTNDYFTAVEEYEKEVLSKR